MAKKEAAAPFVAPKPHMVRAYFIAGTPPKGSGPYAIDNPPAGGWCHVVLVRGEKRSTLLSPYTLESWQVPNGCMELAHSRAVDASPDRIADLIVESWKKLAALGMQRDYAVAALVLTELGAEVPRVEVLATAGKDDGAPRVQGGKPVNEEALRPVDPESKRGAVARFFSNPVPQSLHEAMARLQLTRSGVLSHLFCLNRDHGVGYTLANDCATLLLPEGFDLFAYVKPERKVAVVQKLNPYASQGSLAEAWQRGHEGQPMLAHPGSDYARVYEEGKAASQPKPEPKKRTSGKPVNAEALAPIPEPGKRATVARLFVGGFYPIKEAEQRLELNRSAVLSHLFTINKENGLGYELSEDGSRARLIVPDGHEPFCAKQPRARKQKEEA